MDPRHARILAVSAATIAAVWLGVQIGEGSFAVPLAAVVLVCGIWVVALSPWSVTGWLLGGLLLGNIVGNRGFAQLMLVGGAPILPAEAGLAATVILLIWACARLKAVPVRWDSLNVAVAVWLVVGTARFLFDLPTHRFNAIRDYATVYYAAFFFIAQWAVRRDSDQLLLRQALVAAVLVLVPVYFAFQARPEWFLERLTLRDWPIIYIKPDLALTFLAAGAVAVACWCRPRRLALALGVALSGLVLIDESRAAALGLLVASGWLLLGRRPALPVAQTAAGGLGAIVLVVLAYGFEVRPVREKIDAVVERARSITDPTGAVVYESEESGAKGDNNRFRWVWWQEVAEETWKTNPVFGLGFGHDLSRQFVQSYYPDLAEEFSARSPHSIWMTAFGRGGVVGLLAWVGVTIALARRTWAALRVRTDEALGGFLASWVIYVSACFGVVLEGPMGAVVFWILLGAANGTLPLAVPAPTSRSPQRATVATPPGATARVREFSTNAR